jgi:hypothetical protein
MSILGAGAPVLNLIPRGAALKPPATNPRTGKWEPTPEDTNPRLPYILDQIRASGCSEVYHLSEIDNFRNMEIYVMCILHIYMYYVSNVFNFNLGLRIYMRGFRSTIHILTIGRKVKMCKVDPNDP